jgi:peptidoglycan LD-endopeptidase LytH
MTSTWIRRTWLAAATMAFLAGGLAAASWTPNGDDDRRRDAVAELRSKHLKLPVEAAKIEAMRGQFGERRGGGNRGHEAVDLLAPRGTPVRAVESGRIAKLFRSKAGGITVYQFDPSNRFCYYYAHLDRYAAGLREGEKVDDGEIIGYVGTTGNAPANTPHLHFAIFELTSEKHWWQGTPIDPFLAFGGA